MVSLAAPIIQSLIRGRSLRVRWWRNKETGVMEQWSFGVLPRPQRFA
jgi:hypothetical protein